MNDIS